MLQIIIRILEAEKCRSCISHRHTDRCLKFMTDISALEAALVLRMVMEF